MALFFGVEADFGRPRFFGAEAGVETVGAGSEEVIIFFGLPLFFGPVTGSSDPSFSSESSDSSGSIILFLCTRGEVLRGGRLYES